MQKPLIVSAIVGLFVGIVFGVFLTIPALVAVTVVVAFGELALWLFTYNREAIAIAVIVGLGCIVFLVVSWGTAGLVRFDSLRVSLSSLDFPVIFR